MMNLKWARAFLLSRLPWVSRVFGRYAVAGLERAADPAGVDVLVEAMKTASGRLRQRIIGALERETTPAKIERLWRLWSESRDPAIGEILRRRGVPANQADLAELSRLKLGREQELPLGRSMFSMLAPWFADPDADVAGACRRYLRRVRDAAPRDGVLLQLHCGAYAEIGVDRQSVQQVLALLDDPEAVPLVRAYLDQLPPALRDYANLRSGQLANVRFDPDNPGALIPFLDDADPEVRRQACRFFAELRRRRPEYWVTAMLCRGLPEQLGCDAATIRLVLPLIEHRDCRVRTAVRAYIAGLPASAMVDETCYAVWLRHDSATLLEALRTAGRQAPSPAVECLIALLETDLARYRRLADDDGELFREAWLIANAGQRERLSNVVVHSRDEALIAAYRQAMSTRRDYDLDLHFRALCAAGLDDELFALLGRMTLRQAFELGCRWRRTGWRPAAAADVVEDLVQLVDRFLVPPEVEPATTPPGTKDLLAAWLRHEETQPLPIARLSANPAVRAAGLVRGVVSGSLGPRAIAAARQAPDWLERLAAAVLGPAFAGGRDPIIWVETALGRVGELPALPVSANPDQIEIVQRQLRRLNALDGVLAVRLRILFEILARLQQHFCTGVSVVPDDTPADACAIGVTDAPLDLFAAPAETRSDPAVPDTDRSRFVINDQPAATPADAPCR